MAPKPHSLHSVGKQPRSEDYLDQTIKVWQPYSKRTLTREDAQEIATNVLGFFLVLREWTREDIMQRSSLERAQPPIAALTSKTQPSS
jgi:hypothetical protein